MNRDVVELLAPAKDFACGKAAFDCGADAVYIGAERFGARENAGNSVEDIARLAEYGRRYWAKTYVTLNTLLYEKEIPQAVRLVERLYDIGIDGLIVQDVGLLECDLPPIPLIASTQMHNDSAEKAAFLEGVGFRRIILARELSLDEIAVIREAAPSVELEYFVHGALCVCYSGQCSMSYAIGGRSANRGECAQPCRKPYTLEDGKGTVLQKEKHLLSIRDLNQSGNLRELIDAGVRSFKIEGRLKDRAYVTNAVAYYRRELDRVLDETGMRRASSGTSRYDFTPDLAKTFNRGYTTYFLHGRGDRIGTPDTPKAYGERIGKIVAVGKKGVTVESKETLHPGDGICFFDKNHKLCGTLVNGVRGNTFDPAKTEGLEVGMVLFRNHDHAFLMQLEKSRTERRVSMRFSLLETNEGLRLSAADEDGVTAECVLEGPFEAAKNAERALETIRAQLAKTGDSEFDCAGVDVRLERSIFLPISALNDLRRRCIVALRAERLAKRPLQNGGAIRNEVPYPVRELSFLGNVLNSKAEAFYRRHGVERIEAAAEAGEPVSGRTVMTTKYCIKHQLNACPKINKGARLYEPLTLVDGEGRRFTLRFDCERCVMEIVC